MWVRPPASVTVTLDLVRGGALVVEAGTGLDADLVADELELAGGIGARTHR